MHTQQEKFWAENFGDDYIGRNTFSNDQMDEFYTSQFGVSRSAMNQNFLADIQVDSVLEAGCNIGNQLSMLQSQGKTQLYGIEINEKAVEFAKTHTQKMNIVQGSIFDMPFRDGFFDMVFTSGVLIHIHPKDIEQAMREIYRVSKKYIWGFEYYNNEYVMVPYRGNTDRLWKGDFAQKYVELFPDLQIVKREKYKYLTDTNVDEMFLLMKP